MDDKTNNKNNKLSIETNKNQSKYHKMLKSSLELLGGGISGLVVAIALNPWDRALYLSVKENRKFLDTQNFKRPFQGVTQALIQKTISHGMYFPLESKFVRFSTLQFGHVTSMHHLIGGSMAGCVNALIMNPISALKYTRWGEEQALTIRAVLQGMSRGGGVKQFSKGIYATMSRDCVFGAIFASMRLGLRDSYKRSKYNSKHLNSINATNGTETSLDRYSSHAGKQVKIGTVPRIGIDMASAFVATTASSPFNYVRNMQYATPKEVNQIESMYRCLRDLWTAGIEHGNGNNLNRLRFYMFRLRIGWGTARVAVGMALTGFGYEAAVKYFKLERHD